MKNSRGPHQIRPTQPPTRDPQPVDNSARTFGAPGAVMCGTCWHMHGPGTRCQVVFFAPEREDDTPCGCTNWTEPAD
jgi:hypothetical protein